MATKISDSLYLVDGQMDFSGGVDSGRVTSIAVPTIPYGIPRTMLSWLHNGTVRGGSISPRAGWVRRVVVPYTAGEKFQGGFLYEPEGAYPYVVVSIGGRLVALSPDTGMALDLSATFGLYNPSTPERVWMVQGEKYLIVQAGDFESPGAVVPGTTDAFGRTLPLFWDGSTLRRSIGVDPTVTPGLPGRSELPPAETMCYYQGRLWYAQGRIFSAGDIVGGNAGTVANAFRDAILNVTENPLSVGGDGFAVPSAAGYVRALAYTAQVDTALGQGPLYIFTRKQVFRLVVPVSRADWIAAGNQQSGAQSDNPLQTVAQIRWGAVNDRSIVHANGDLYYQTMEPGIRSLILAIRYYEQWGNTPISRNVNRAVKLNDRSLLGSASGIEFDNRIWQTCMPTNTAVGVAHQGIVALDFDIMSSMQDKLAQTTVPAWEGMIEPGLILQLWEGDWGGLQRAFALMWFDGTKSLELWEATSYLLNDQDDARVPWLFETAAYNWNSPFGLKELETFQLWFDQIYGTVDVFAYFREDSNPCWHKWTAFRLCVARGSVEAGVGDATYPTYYCPDGAIPVTLPKAPGTECNNLNGRPVNWGMQFQLKLEIKGRCRVRGILGYAQAREAGVYEGLACPPVGSFDGFPAIISSPPPNVAPNLPEQSGNIIQANLVEHITQNIRNGIQGLSPSATTEDIFSTRDNATKSYTRSTTIWKDSVNWTCIPSVASQAGDILANRAWFHGVLVTPDIVIGANHADCYETLGFVDANNNLYERVIQGGMTGGIQIGSTDIKVKRLTFPVPDSITPAKVLPVWAYQGATVKIRPSERAAGIPCVFSNRRKELLVGQCSEIDTYVGLVSPSATDFVPWYTAPSGGDSASGIFFIIENQPVLLSTLFNVTMNPCISENVTAINAAIIALGSSTQLTFIDLTDFISY